MPNIKSAIKRVKVNEKKKARNRALKSALHTSVKKYTDALANGTANAESLAQLSRAVDKAASKGIIHKNAASRKKARMAKALNKAQNA